MGRKIYNWIDKNLERYIMAILLAVIVCMMIFDVVMRYVFNAGQAFPQEVSRYAMLYITFFGVAYGVRFNAHLRVDVIPALIPKTRFFFNTFGDIVMIAFGVLMFIYGISKLQSLIASGQYSTALHLPMWIVYLGLEIGWGLTLLRFVQKYSIMLYNIANHRGPIWPGEEVAQSENEEIKAPL